MTFRSSTLKFYRRRGGRASSPKHIFSFIVIVSVVPNIEGRTGEFPGSVIVPVLGSNCLPVCRDCHTRVRHVSPSDIQTVTLSEFGSGNLFVSGIDRILGNSGCLMASRGQKQTRKDTRADH